MLARFASFSGPPRAKRNRPQGDRRKTIPGSRSRHWLRPPRAPILFCWGRLPSLYLWPGSIPGFTCYVGEGRSDHPGAEEAVAPGARLSLYSPECVEGLFPETRMQDPAYPRAERARNALSAPPLLDRPRQEYARWMDMRLPESSWRPDNLTSRPATFLMYNPPRGSHIRKLLPSEDAPPQAAQAPALWTLCARLRARGIGPGLRTFRRLLDRLRGFWRIPRGLQFGYALDEPGQ